LAEEVENSTFVVAVISRFEVTTKRKPFDFFVERLDLKKSRGDCDSFEPTPEIITDFVAVAMECRPGALGVLDELVIKTQTAIAPE